MESLKGEGIPARNYPSESPSQAVILIIIHFDGTKVIYFYFFYKAQALRGKRTPPMGTKMVTENRSVTVIFYLFIYFAVSVPLPLSLLMLTLPAPAQK